MLLQMVNMADVARGMGPQVARSGKGGGRPSLQVRQPAPQVEQPSGVTQTGVAKSGATKTGRDGGNVRGDAVSDRRGRGAWLEQRAELIKLAQPLLDQGVPVSQVHEALQQFVERKRWGFLSPATLEEIVEAAIDALVEAEMEEDAAQRAGNLVPQADELHEVSLADITPEPVRWLWPGKIPLNKVTVIYGEAGIGKTCLALDLAARVSAGTTFLDGTSGPEARQVLIVNGEDSLVDGISPRLVGGGANLQNISVIAATFHNQTLWGSIGWAPPAAFGAALAAPDRRTILITGEGSHQLTAQEVGQFHRFGLKPIIFVLNNNGYLVERLLCKNPDVYYNDLAQWRYHLLPQALGCDGWYTSRVTTCGELDAALAKAESCNTGAYIEVVTDKYVAPPLATKLHQSIKSLYKN